MVKCGVKMEWLCNKCGKELATRSGRPRGTSGFCRSCSNSRPFSDDHKGKIATKLKVYVKTSDHCEAISRAAKEHYKDPTKTARWKGGQKTYWRKVARKVMGVTDPNIEVHHMDEDITNNDPSNLMLLSASEHTSLHNIQGRSQVALEARWSKRP